MGDITDVIYSLWVRPGSIYTSNAVILMPEHKKTVFERDRKMEHYSAHQRNDSDKS